LESLSEFARNTHLEAFTNLEAKRSTMRGFKIAQGKLAQKIWTAGQRLLRLEKRRASVPRRVPVHLARKRLKFTYCGRLVTENQVALEEVAQFPQVSRPWRCHAGCDEC